MEDILRNSTIPQAHSIGRLVLDLEPRIMNLSSTDKPTSILSAKLGKSVCTIGLAISPQSKTVVNIYLGLRPREIFLPCMQYLSIFHAEGWNIYWRASEASETPSGVYKFDLVRYIYIYLLCTNAPQIRAVP